MYPFLNRNSSKFEFEDVTVLDNWPTIFNNKLHLKFVVLKPIQNSHDVIPRDVITAMTQKQNNLAGYDVVATWKPVTPSVTRKPVTPPVTTKPVTPPVTRKPVTPYVTRKPVTPSVSRKPAVSTSVTRKPVPQAQAQTGNKNKTINIVVPIVVTLAVVGVIVVVYIIYRYV